MKLLDNVTKVFEAFAGYGSQRLKIEELGINAEYVGTSEIDPDAIIAYAAVHKCFISTKGLGHEFMRKYLIDRNIGINFKTGKTAITRMSKAKVALLYSAAAGQECYGDISILNMDQIPFMDLFTYSFPCQDITNNGNGEGLEEGSETRSSLLWECKKVFKGKKPKTGLMENVTNLLSKANKKYPKGHELEGQKKPNSSNWYHFNKWLDWLEDQGYNNYFEIVNAYECGISQKRRRVFLVSILKEHDDGSFKFEKNMISRPDLREFLEINGKNVLPVVDKNGLVKNVSNDYLVADKFFEKEEKPYYALIGGKKVYHDRPFLVKVDGKIEVRQATIKGFDIAEDGDSITMDIPTSPTRRGRRQDKATATLTTSCNIAVWIDGILRYLTPRECLRLMGLNDAAIDRMITAGISENVLYKLAGNSIVTNAMEFIKNIPTMTFIE